MTGKKILIIEDNLLNLELTTDLLEANGFVVHSAQTAEEGLRLARELLPDLVLMDFSLPGMDGLSATQNLKADPLTRRLIVVGLTANAMKGDEELALHAGCDRCRHSIHRIGNITPDKKQPLKICKLKPKN